MSLHLDFEPHSWYMGYAIKKNQVTPLQPLKWTAVTDDGMYTYSIASTSARTLKELKQKIKAYHVRQAERDAYNRRMIGERV